MARKKKQKQQRQHYDLIESDGVPIKAWSSGVDVQPEAVQQLRNTAALPFVYQWLAAMPDVHWGLGATVGSVVATQRAIVPAAVGVDIGCGMMAVQTSLRGSDLPDSLRHVRVAIEAAVPHGRTDGGRKGDRGAWKRVPNANASAWARLEGRFKTVCDKHPGIAKSNNVKHLGTLGSGNHFVEVCLDEGDRVWVMLHSGSRGVGGRIGNHFIRLAREEMLRWHIRLPDRDLAYLPEGSRYFDDYIEAVGWAQDFARENRRLMMDAALEALRGCWGIPPFAATASAVNCHHNYVAKEVHYGESVWVTRKGALRARQGDLGIIPGSMGTRSYIVRGLGNPESFHSCSHGAGRAMSRAQARKRFSVADHAAATEGVECRKDKDVIDETPGAYEDIDAVMLAQRDLVDVVHTLRQVVCVKG